jgi:hypothetical protein
MPHWPTSPSISVMEGKKKQRTKRLHAMNLHKEEKMSAGIVSMVLCVGSIAPVPASPGWDLCVTWSTVKGDVITSHKIACSCQVQKDYRLRVVEEGRCAEEPAPISSSRSRQEVSTTEQLASRLSGNETRHLLATISSSHTPIW